MQSAENVFRTKIIRTEQFIPSHHLATTTIANAFQQLFFASCHQNFFQKSNNKNGENKFVG
jgi:hypothetical protein